MFTSTTQTKLGYQDRGHTFNRIRVQPDGSLLTVERSGGRDVPRGMIVRYANPFASSDAPEVLQEAKESLTSMTYGAGGAMAGALYAVSTKKLYSNETGAWKASAVKATPPVEIYSLATVAWHGDTLWVSDYRGFHRREGNVWRTVLADPSASPTNMFGQGALLYLGYSKGVVVWDEATQTATPLAKELMGGWTMPQAEFTAADAARINLYAGTALFRGTATSFERVAIEVPEDVKRFDVAVSALGATYIATGTALYRLDGTKLEKVVHATGWIARACSGNDEALWIANGTELLCTDGKAWRVVARVHDDTTRA